MKLGVEANMETGYARLKLHHFLTPLTQFVTGSKPPPQLDCANRVQASLKINIPHLQCVKLGSIQFESVDVKGVSDKQYVGEPMVDTIGLIGMPSLWTLGSSYIWDGSQ